MTNSNGSHYRQALAMMSLCVRVGYFVCFFLSRICTGESPKRLGLKRRESKAFDISYDADACTAQMKMERNEKKAVETSGCMNFLREKLTLFH